MQKGHLFVGLLVQQPEELAAAGAAAVLSAPKDASGHLVQLGAEADLEMYTVEVMTANAMGTGTDSNCHITMYGTAGRTPRLHMVPPEGNHKKLFEPGKTDIFTFVTPDIGDIEAIRLYCGGALNLDSWQPETVTIQCSNGKRYLCEWRTPVSGASKERKPVLPLSDHGTPLPDGARIVAGPFLKFRRQEGKLWKLSTLIATHKSTTAPPFEVWTSDAAKPATAVTKVYELAQCKNQLWRYDWEVGVV